MGLTNYPNGISSFGVPVLGGAGGIITGSVFFVDSNTGDNSYKGTSKDKPFATVDYAVGKCTADKGDTIVVMPGHSETISASGTVTFDVAGVNVVGIGHGTLQPKFDYTVAAGSVEVDADNVSLQNLRFHANVTSVIAGLNVVSGATDLIVRGCRFDVETTATDEFLIGIKVGVGCDRLLVEDTEIDMGLGGAVAAIKWHNASAGAWVENVTIKGDYSQACVASVVAASTELYFKDCRLFNGTTGNIGAVEVAEMYTGTTGAFISTQTLANVATIAAHFVADAMATYNVWSTEDVGPAASAINRSDAVSVTGSADD